MSGAGTRLPSLARPGRGLLRGLAAAAFAWFTVVAAGFVSPDEAWFLQVVHRVRSGETLYRDVCFGVTPLSIQLTRALASVFGTQVLVSRTVVMGCFLATLWFCCRAVDRTGGTARTPLLLIASTIVFGTAQLGVGAPTPYTPLAVALFMGTFASALAWLRSDPAAGPAVGRLVLAGTFAGLCFGTKQNMGVCALAALLAAILTGRPRGGRARLRDITVAMASFFAASSLVLLPVWIQGGGERLLFYGFLNKEAYIEAGSVPYSSFLARVWELIKSPRWPRYFISGHSYSTFLLPPLTLALLVLAWMSGRSTQRRYTAGVMAFAVGACLSVFPRGGSSSILAATPAVLVGLVHAWDSLRSRIPVAFVRACTLAATVWVAGGLVLSVAGPVCDMVWGDLELSTIPHFRGVLVDREVRREILEQAAVISRATAGQPTFLIGPNTGFFYLTAGVTNPSPFDYPYVSILGRQGEEQVVSAIRSNRIRYVFLFFGPEDRQTPIRLLNVVRGEMSLVSREDFGALYRSRELAPSP